MQTTCKSNATNATNAQNLGPKRGGGGEAAAPPFWGAAEGRPPSFVHLLHLLRCFYMLFACFAFVLHLIYILFASLLGMMRQLLRQWLLPRMLWMLMLMLLLLLLLLLLIGSASGGVLARRRIGQGLLCLGRKHSPPPPLHTRKVQQSTGHRR